jgi:adenine-specific DNA-methyltransferase
VYAKSESFGVNLLPRTKEADDRYSNPDNDPRGLWKGASFLNPASPQERPNLCYPITNLLTGEVTNPTTNAWRRSKEEFQKLADNKNLYWGKDGRQPVPSIKMFLSEARGLTPINFWSHEYAGNTDQGTRDLEKLFGKKLFDNPKPVSLMKRIIEHASDKNSIIMDFFSGSASLAEAVFLKNSEDEGSRQFIMIQLPEPPNDQSWAAKNKFTTIAEIGKERIRRAGKEIKAELTKKYKARQGQMLVPDDEKVMNPDDLDIGFKVFKLDSSNLKKWNPNADNLDTSLFDSIENFVEGRDELDVVYEIMLKYGIDLTLPTETYNVGDKKIFSVGLGALMICLGNEITTDVAQEIVKLKAELTPEVMRVVFKDNGFKDDSAKTNTKEILRTNGVDEIVSI